MVLIVLERIMAARVVEALTIGCACGGDPFENVFHCYSGGRRLDAAPFGATVGRERLS